MPQIESTTLPLKFVRILSVVKQGLHIRPRKNDKQTLLDIIRQIGLLQLDTINVVARSHYLVMLSRIGVYNPVDLDSLLFPDRCLFEQWAHAACLIPVDDFVHFAPLIHARRQSSYQSPHRRLRQLSNTPGTILEDVLSKVRELGPANTSNFKDDSSNKQGKWFEWKPAKVALESLFEQGYLMVDRRVNFRRYYDLAERVLPISSEPITKTAEDWQRWAALHSIDCLGVATINQVSDYYRQKKPAVKAVIDNLVAEGIVLPVEVDGWKEGTYLNPMDIPLLNEIADGKYQPTLTTFLSPFDNLIWDRSRVRDLFGFEYSLELYTPLAKKTRRYGYYVMPILHRGDLVGRLDPKVERRTKTLIIQAVFLEPDKTITDDLVTGIADAMREFMAFHNCQTLVIRHSVPEELGELLLERVNSIQNT